MQLRPLHFALAALTLGLILFAAYAADEPGSNTPIDWERARQLLQKEKSGEQLSADERAYLDRAKAERQKRMGNREAGGGGAAGGGAPDKIGDIDMNRAKEIYQKIQRGENVSDEDRAYLDRAKAAMQKRQQDAGGRVAGSGDAANGGAPDKIGDIDINRAKDINQRIQRSENVSNEDREYLERAKAAMRQRQGGGGGGQPGGRPQGKPAITGQESTNLVPLTQLKDKYKDFDGGLYGGGKNTPPEAHMKAAQTAAASITTLDAAGKPAADGKIVLMSMGMSNTTQEFSRFKQVADADPAKSPKLVIVDAAQGGKDAAAWTNGATGPKPGNAVWDEADRRIKAAGATPEQVQIIWLKQALIAPVRHGEFPEHAKVLQGHVETAITLAKQRYPNLKLVYLSSRIYAGYAVTQLNPEPYAYEGAFAMRWVIEDQIKGDPRLNYDPAKGDVKAPVVLWGPYIWTNGTKGRESDDVVVKAEDLAGDGTHPSQSGRQKVAEMLLKFFTTDPTAKVWFVKP